MSKIHESKEKSLAFFNDALWELNDYLDSQEDGYGKKLYHDCSFTLKQTDSGTCVLECLSGGYFLEFKKLFKSYEAVKYKAPFGLDSDIYYALGNVFDKLGDFEIPINKIDFVVGGEFRQIGYVKGSNKEYNIFLE